MQLHQEVDRHLRRAVLKVIYSDQTSVSAASILLFSEEARRLFQWLAPLPLTSEVTKWKPYWLFS